MLRVFVPKSKKCSKNWNSQKRKKNVTSSQSSAVVCVDCENTSVVEEKYLLFTRSPLTNRLTPVFSYWQLKLVELVSRFICIHHSIILFKSNRKLSDTPSPEDKMHPSLIHYYSSGKMVKSEDWTMCNSPSDYELSLAFNKQNAIITRDSRQCSLVCIVMSALMPSLFLVDC